METFDLQFPPRPVLAEQTFPAGYPIRVESTLPRIASPLLEIFGAFQTGESLPPKTTYRLVRARPKAKGFSMRIRGKTVFVHRHRQRFLWKLDWVIMKEKR